VGGDTRELSISVVKPLQDECRSAATNSRNSTLSQQRV
jgi:hypothetical protein